jgi:3-dehydroquinate synthase
MTIPSDPYNIYIGENVLNDLAGFISQPMYEHSKMFILVDENTYKHCLTILLKEIPELQAAHIIEVMNGEENKNVDVCVQVWQTLTEQQADRKSLFINIGGGVISDMGGFIAATFKRGIDFINIPTTLLSQVDASVGGKLGIDLDGYKNQIGLFTNPKAVFVYVPFLESLDNRQIKSGFSEIIKHGLIFDKVYWAKIKETDVESIAQVSRLIERSIEIKNTIVLLDPHEKGIRKALNFGHTIGHAVESYSLLNNTLPLLHGEAIAIGIVCEAYLSAKISGLSAAELLEITAFIKSKYTPYQLLQSTEDDLIELMMNDKKNEQQTINFSLLPEIGKISINQTADTVLIKEALGYYRKHFNNVVKLN